MRNVVKYWGGGDKSAKDKKKMEKKQLDEIERNQDNIRSISEYIDKIEDQFQNSFGGRNVWILLKSPKPVIQYLFMLLQIISKDLERLIKSEDRIVINALEKMILQSQHNSKYIQTLEE